MMDSPHACGATPTSMEKLKTTRATISALLDDALPAPERELAVEALATPDGRQSWALYCRIGDALRAQPAPELSAQFGAKLAAALEASAPVQPRPRQRKRAAPGAGANAAPQPAAPDTPPLPSIASER